MTEQVERLVREADDRLLIDYSMGSMRDTIRSLRDNLIALSSQLAEARGALEKARPYVANVVDAEGRLFNRRDLEAIDAALPAEQGEE